MIVSRQKDMAVQFLSSYSRIFSEDITGHRLNLIEVLYYKLVEQILLEEQTKRPNIDTQVNKVTIMYCPVIVHSY